MSETTTESWDGLLVNYLKADNLKEQQEDFGCINVEVQEKEMTLHLEREGDKPFLFGLNTTNKVFLKNNGIASPKDVIGKKITIKKVLAMNPTTKKEVDSLRICGVQ